MVIPILGVDMETTLFSFGGSRILGFLTGYSLKRIIKIAAIIIGAFILRIGLSFLQGMDLSPMVNIFHTCHAS